MKEQRPGVWRFRVYAGRDPVTGKKLQASKTFHGTVRQAETALAAFVGEVDTGHAYNPAMTVSGLLATFCDHSERVGRSPTTVDRYRHMARDLEGGHRAPEDRQG